MNKIEAIVRSATKGILSEEMYQKISIEIERLLNGDPETERVSKYKSYDIPKDIYNYFMKIDSGKGNRISKSQLYKGIPDTRRYSQRKITTLFEKYLYVNGIDFIHGRTNSDRFFVIM